METHMYKVTICDQTREYPEGTPYGEIVQEFEAQSKYPVVLVMVDGRLRELHKRLKNDCTISLVSIADGIGHKTYKRSMNLLLLKSIYHVAGHENIEKIVLHFTVGEGYYYTVKGNVTIDRAFLDKVESYMREMVEKKVPILKRSVATDTARELFRQHRMYDKEKLFRFRRVSRVNIYRLGEFEDYFYGFMCWHTGYLKHFHLEPYDEGFVMQMPLQKNPEIVPPFEPSPKIFKIQKESEKWGEMMEVSTAGELNEKICQGNMQKLMLISEALQEGKISRIAEQICERKDVKFVMIAGPSSSGKTTFSHRLSIQLAAHGLKPHPIAVDNYFVDRDKTPLHEDGTPNFEGLGALDVEKFNEDMCALLRGECVELPRFNFKKGTREYKGDFLQMKPNDILVIEGIHCLNDKMSYALPKESKFKIYISALTQLNIDEHNRIPTTDGRLIRRMVRDNRTRGASAKNTIAMWQSVRLGEEENIFPYQEAKRLLKFLDYFLAIPNDDVPHNSILREFVGGSCFEV